MKEIYFFKCGGNSPYHAWEYGDFNTERHYREEPGFQVVKIFPAGTTDEEVIEFARENGHPLLPGLQR